MKSLLALFLSLSCGWAWADHVDPIKQETLDLHYYQDRFAPQGTLFLKAKTMEEYPWIQIHDYDLVEVTLYAKSRFGRGQAELLINGQSAGIQTVPGRPRQFDWRDTRTFYPIRFVVPYGMDSSGTWQIGLNGDIKVDIVNMVIQPWRRPVAPIRDLREVHRLWHLRLSDHLQTLDPYEGRNQGYQYEGVSFIGAAQWDHGLIPIYRCRSNEDHFLSREVNCEGGINEGLLIYLGAARTRETPVEIFRCFRADLNDHMATATPEECHAHRYVIEGTLGFSF